VASKICRIHSKERASVSYVHLQANACIYKETENLSIFLFLTVHVCAAERKG
jgi:hypothetical protein